MIGGALTLFSLILWYVCYVVLRKASRKGAYLRDSVTPPRQGIRNLLG